MSALEQFAIQETPPPPVPVATSTSLDQPRTEQPSAWTSLTRPWHGPRFMFTQLVVVDLALQGFEEPRTIFYQHSAAPVADEQIRVVEDPRQQEPLAHHILSETRNQEAHQDRASRALEQAYVFGDRREILAFIMGSRVIEELLLEAQEPLNSAFGQESVKKLTLVEDDEGFVTLFCFILAPGNLHEARRALRSFDESWWLARSGKVGGKLNFDFELI